VADPLFNHSTEYVTMGRPATFSDLTEILREQSEAIQEKLNVASANMFIPTDGKGLRIRVSVPHDCPDDLPEELEMRLNDGTDVDVPLDISKDFRPFEPR